MALDFNKIEDRVVGYTEKRDSGKISILPVYARDFLQDARKELSYVSLYLKYDAILSEMDLHEAKFSKDRAKLAEFDWRIWSGERRKITTCMQLIKDNYLSN